MKFFIINGPNLNMLGYRNKLLYGEMSYEELKKELICYGASKSIDIEVYQSNHEGDIIDLIHRCILERVDGIIINPGALTHYSYAIRDALEIAVCKKVEVHLSNIYEREDFRGVSVICDVVDASFFGKKHVSYFEAIDYILSE